MLLAATPSNSENARHVDKYEKLEEVWQEKGAKLVRKYFPPLISQGKAKRKPSNLWDFARILSVPLRRNGSS